MQQKLCSPLPFTLNIRPFAKIRREWSVFMVYSVPKDIPYERNENFEEKTEIQLFSKP